MISKEKGKLILACLENNSYFLKHVCSRRFALHKRLIAHCAEHTRRTNRIPNTVIIGPRVCARAVDQVQSKYYTVHNHYYMICMYDY